MSVEAELNWLQKLHRFGGAAEVVVDDSTSPTYVRGVKQAAKLIVLTGTLTANRSVVMPLEQGADWIVVNATTGGYAVAVGGSTGTVVEVPSGALRYVATDGVDFQSVLGTADLTVPGPIGGTTPSTGAFTQLTLMPAGSSGESTTKIINAKASTADGTPTTIFTLGPAANSIVDIDAVVVAVRDDGTAFRRQSISGSFSVDATPEALEMGASDKSGVKSSGLVTSMDIGFSTVGFAIMLQVTGRLAEGWRWGVTGKITQRSSAA